MLAIWSTIFPTMTLPGHHHPSNRVNLKDLPNQPVGRLPALHLYVQLTLTFLTSLREPAELALLGFVLIFGAVLLRKALPGKRPEMNSVSHAEPQTK